MILTSQPAARIFPQRTFFSGKSKLYSRNPESIGGMKETTSLFSLKYNNQFWINTACSFFISIFNLLQDYWFTLYNLLVKHTLFLENHITKTNRKQYNSIIVQTMCSLVIYNDDHKVMMLSLRRSKNK